MKFDFQRLRGKIISEYGTLGKFCEIVGQSLTSLSYKLNNKRTFTYDDIVEFTKLLNIPKEEIGDYFFTPLV